MVWQVIERGKDSLLLEAMQSQLTKAGNPLAKWRQVVRLEDASKWHVGDRVEITIRKAS